jgi:hypothetical protein
MKLRAVVAIVVVLALFVVVKALSHASGGADHVYVHEVPGRGEITLSVPDVPIRTLPEGHEIRLSIEHEELVAMHGLYMLAWPVPSVPTGEMVMQFVPAEPGVYTAIIPPGEPTSRVTYQIMVQGITGPAVLYPSDGLTVEFRGPVASWAIVGHIVFLFVAVAFFTVATLYAFETFRTGTFAVAGARSVLWGTASLVFGGIALGVIVEYQRLGMLWGGFPVGSDVTDTKTLLNTMLWIVALLLIRGSAFRDDPSRDSVSARGAAWLVIAMFAITLIVFLVPHSVVL